MKVKNLMNGLHLIAASALITLAVSCTDQPGEKDGDSDNSATLPVEKPLRYFMDVHHIGKGKVTAEGVAGAHAKDLATEGKYGVHFMKYWVDEKEGNVYCLASSKDSLSIHDSHAEAHGLIPDRIFEVTGGPEGKLTDEKNFYLDIHELGAGKVTAKDVAAAHQKDLAVQVKHGVNFVDYWLDEKEGRVICLSQAKDSASIISAHKEAHGLLPASIMKVKPGGDITLK